jgi:starch synthase
MSSYPEHVAFLTAEMAPLVKVGGLADVVGALPSALAAQGVRCDIFLPAYKSIDRKKHDVRVVRSGLDTWAGRAYKFDLLEASPPADGVRCFLIDGGGFFDREGIYTDPKTKEDYTDTAERFAFFTRASLDALRWLGERIDVVHSHDHQTALASFFVKKHFADDPSLGGASTVYTLHNLGYQGAYPPAVLDLLGVPADQFYPMGPFEHLAHVNWMKIGISFADEVSTVSPSYAREICEDKVQGASLEGLLTSRREHLTGILNGVDVDEWNPATDEHLPARYDVNRLDGKLDCKRALLEECGLDATDLDTPLIGMITRLVDQKGLDLVELGFEKLLGSGARFVVLGTGLSKYESFLERVAKKNPDCVASLIKFDNGLAHRIEAGSDMFLMPSLYEPCGLNQMYSLRYGAIPIVRATGGLADTVVDVDDDSEGVGFTFLDYNVDMLTATVDRAVRTFEDRERWRGIMGRAMRLDLSWKASAERYIELYRKAALTRA